ncbi:PTS beta-glucoside transporter subunit EIIBCA [Lacticaseibacillus zeae]|uniref:PTS system sucrose-specific EIIBCA component n=1 Tax=Lacticaseibacillus zeae TaxID=57037 RepID=A0A5R8LNT0_LACZE|nr:beta-glucoside-specific PTS transporter subunit IIABC [Lacticaseibacillus zeae]TLF38845.1 PTS beta-glucoside transporter subunit EIIBCA [Lacticaseibacillus zeae]
MNDKELAMSILNGVGGKDNIKGITHCVTRLRFILSNESKANDQKLKDIDGVLDVVKQGGQYQVVIGPRVAKVYDAVVDAGQLSDTMVASGDEADTTEKDSKKQGMFSSALNLISSIFIPVLGILSGAGMIKAVMSVCSVMGWLKPTDGTYVIMNALGDTLFYFFPVAIGWSAAKKFKLPDIYGLTIGAFLIYPTLVSAATSKAMTTIFKGTIFALNYKLTFLGIPVALQNYSNTVIPIIVIIWFASYVRKWFEKIIPDVVQIVMVPFFTLLITGVLSLIIIGPIAMILQNILSDSVLWLVSLNKGIAGFALGSLWSILVMFGLHWAVIPFFAIDIGRYGFDVINPLIYAGAWAVMGSTIGTVVRNRNKKDRSFGIAAAVSSFFGVNEPALYGVLIPRKKTMVTAFIGAGLGGAIAGLSGSKLYEFGANGPLGTPCFINPKGIDMGFIELLIGGAIAFSFSLFTALAFGAKKDANAKEIDTSKFMNVKVKKSNGITSPVNGESFDLSTVKDEVFASLKLGDGIAFNSSDGKIYAPFDGIIRVAYPTGHAVGIASETDGLEVLIHVGIDTVNLKGEGFTSHVKQGMKVKQGDLLVEFDQKSIKKAGYDTTVMMVVTSTGVYQNIMPTKYGQVNTQDEIMIASRDPLSQVTTAKA